MFTGKLFFQLGALLTIPLSAYSAQNPTISLFPTTVVENLKSTGQAATKIEDGLEAVVRQIDEQKNLYVDNDCMANANDPGCVSLRKQMSQTYLDMLKQIETGLPAIQKTINVTRMDLEKRIQSQLGKGMSMASLQNVILNDNRKQDQDPVKKLRGNSGVKLSQRFQQYYQLVRASTSASQTSLAIMASEIYLDLEDTQKFITMTQQEMQRARILVELDQELGLVNNEMLEVVNGAKGILFGEDDSAPSMLVPESPQVSQTEFRSPLER
jgi:hypothetical protein